jgi:hypothetical protein
MATARNAAHPAQGTTMRRIFRVPVRAVLATGCAISCLFPGAASAHHSYAMFDMRQSVIVQGTVAKIEWTNPHVFIWLYVKKPNKSGEYDLFGFENAPVNFLTRLGWTKSSLKPGEKVTVQYFPLRDGRPGGFFIKAVHVDGGELDTDPFAPGVAAVLEQDKSKAVPRPTP